MKLNELVLTKEEIIQAIDRQSEKEGLSRTTIYFYGSEAVSLATVKKMVGWLDKQWEGVGAENGKPFVSFNIDYDDWQEIKKALEATEGKEAKDDGHR